MNIAQTWATSSTSSDATEALAAKLAANCRGSEVIELASDLGGGKTTFVRGLARGLGSTDHVSSPTFKISNEYAIPSARGRTSSRLIHFDFYRLAEAGVVAQELAEVLGDPTIVVVIEWSGIVQDVLPPERLTVTFEPTGEDSRKLTFSYPKELAYLFPDRL